MQILFLTLISFYFFINNTFSQEQIEEKHNCGFLEYNKISNKFYLENTKKRNLELYNKLIDKSNDKIHKNNLFKIGDELSFFTYNRVKEDYEEVKATLKSEGDQIRIWVENNELKRINSNTLTSTNSQLTDALEKKTSSKSRNPNLGILDNDEEVFGKASTKYKFNNKTDFLLLDIKQPSGGGVILGYFSKIDQTDEIGSNKLNILYIDSKEGIAGGINQILSTLAHEFQHLIHNGKNPDSEISINEGCSETASILCGYITRGNSIYFKKTNTDLFRWTNENNNDLLADYERMMTYIEYIYEQAGEKTLTELVKNQNYGSDRINEALKISKSNFSWQELHKNYSIALYLQSNDDPRYSFKQKLTLSSAPKPTQITYNGLNYPSTNSIAFESFGISYITYNNPTGLQVKFKSNYPNSISAILFRGINVYEIVDLKNNVDYCLGERGYFDKIVFAISSKSIDEQIVEWSSSNCLAGVNENLSNLKTSYKLSQNNLKVQVQVDKNTKLEYRVFDLNGKNISDKINYKELYLGENIFNVDLSNQSSGIYILNMITENGISNVLFNYKN